MHLSSHHNDRRPFAQREEPPCRVTRRAVSFWSRGSVRRLGRYGEVPEWLKGTDCKSVGLAYAGSKPALSTTPLFCVSPSRRQSDARPCADLLVLAFRSSIFTSGAEAAIYRPRLEVAEERHQASSGRFRHYDGQFWQQLEFAGERGCSLMVKQKPSKLTTRVRFPSPAPTSCLYALRPSPSRVARSCRLQG